MSLDGSSSVFTEAGIEHIQNWLDENYPGSEITYRQAVNGFNVAMSASIPERDTYKPFLYNFIIEKDHYPLYGTVESEDGKSLASMLREPTDIVISRNLADDLEAQVGDHLRLSGASEDFTIRGIVRTDTEPGLQNFIAHIFGYFYLDIRSVDLFDKLVPGQASTLYIKLADPSQVDQAARRLHRLSYALVISTTTDLREANTQISSTIDDLTVIMGLVSLLIGGVGIINTMLVIVSRRTLEVAVLKTVGLEPQEVITLFLVEAVLMGIAGSIIGVCGGWLLALAVKGIAETFLGQSLTFNIAPAPAINGLVVGIVVTAIFGFLPTLAAGKIRPANVLRPNDTIIPRTGRLSAAVAIVCLILAISLVVQGLMGTMLDDVTITGGINLRQIAQAIGAIYGLMVGIAVSLNGILSLRERRRGRNWFLHMLIWLGLIVALPILGAVVSGMVPAVLIMTVTVILVGYLYITLWLVIWAVGGGRISEIWPGVLVLLFPLFWPLIPVLVLLLIPTWILGRFVQRFTFVDFKVAMRSMLATKGRGASTLLALVVGVFTLSIITMLVDTITSVFASLLEDATGGNVLILSAAHQGNMDDIRTILSEQDGIDSFTIVGSYQVQLTRYWDASTGRPLASYDRQSLTWAFSTIDGRDITSNLPDVDFVEGRNLDLAQDSQPDADGYWPVVVHGGSYLNNFEAGVGDLLTFRTPDRKELTFRVVGVTEDTGIGFSNSELYAPLSAFSDLQPESMLGIADVQENKIPALRRTFAHVPGTFVLETRFINDLLNRIIDQFTSFPMLVAALALVTGGIVIANSVALSTLERRREIAIMKAVGLQRERVLGMLLLENGLMGVVGGLIGVGISFVALALLLSQIFKDNLGETLPYVTALSLMGLCVLISLMAALLSVWGASGEKPLNVLRYE